MERKQLALWAYEAEGVGRRTLLRLCSSYGSGVLEALYSSGDLEVSDLLEGAGISPRTVLPRILAARKREPEAAWEALQNTGLRFVYWDEDTFPEKLRHIPDPPFALFVKGELPGPCRPAAAMIGSRDSTPHGRQMARAFAVELASHGVQIVSGMARGIDSVSQTSALDAGGKSFAVLGCGADVCYPEGSRELYDRLPAQGGVISEYLPGTGPKAGQFPPRNRLISGLSDVVIVLEAGRKSGTMITAGQALDQGKDVYAVPGRPDDEKSMGCNDLIRQGAGILTDPSDLLRVFYGEETPSDAMWCLSDLRRERAKLAEQTRRGRREEEKRKTWVQESFSFTSEPDHPEQGMDGSLWSFVYSSLSSQGRTPEELLPVVRKKAGRSVSRTELSHALSRLVTQGLAYEKFGRFALTDRGQDT